MRRTCTPAAVLGRTAALHPRATAARVRDADASFVASPDCRSESPADRWAYQREQPQQQEQQQQRRRAKACEWIRRVGAHLGAQCEWIRRVGAHPGAHPS